MITENFKEAIEEVERIAKEENIKVGIGILEETEGARGIIHRGTVIRSDILGDSKITFYMNDDLDYQNNLIEEVLNSASSFHEKRGTIVGLLMAQSIIDNKASELFLHKKDDDAKLIRSIGDKILLKQKDEGKLAEFYRLEYQNAEAQLWKK